MNAQTCIACISIASRHSIYIIKGQTHEPSLQPKRAKAEMLNQKSCPVVHSHRAYNHKHAPLDNLTIPYG